MGLDNFFGKKNTNGPDKKKIDSKVVALATMLTATAPNAASATSMEQMVTHDPTIGQPLGGDMGHDLDAKFMSQALSILEDLMGIHSFQEGKQIVDRFIVEHRRGLYEDPSGVMRVYDPARDLLTSISPETWNAIGDRDLRFKIIDYINKKSL